jgi:hypothetical protein
MMGAPERLLELVRRLKGEVALLAELADAALACDDEAVVASRRRTMAILERANADQDEILRIRREDRRP